MKIGTLHNIGYRVLGNYPLKFSFLANAVKKNLDRANIRISHVIYISSMFFWAIVATVLTATVTFSLTLAINSITHSNPSIIQLLTLPLGAAAGAGALVLLIFFYYPNYISGGIKTGINKNIVYIVNYMSILSGAGVITEDIFTSLAESGDAYKVSGSAKSVVRDIDVLGKDIVTAMDDESKRTPSKDYAELLQGLIGTTRSGGDVRAYLTETAERQMEVRRRRLSALVSQLNLAAEAYVTIGIAFPVILTTLLSLMGIFGGEIIGGLGPVQIMSLMTYVFFPLASLGIILLVDGMSSSW